MELLVIKIVKAMYPLDYMGDESLELLKIHKDTFVKFAQFSDEEILRLYDLCRS